MFAGVCDVGDAQLTRPRNECPALRVPIGRVVFVLVVRDLGGRMPPLAWSGLAWRVALQAWNWIWADRTGSGWLAMGFGAPQSVVDCRCRADRCCVPGGSICSVPSSAQQTPLTRCLCVVTAGALCWFYPLALCHSAWKGRLGGKNLAGPRLLKFIPGDVELRPRAHLQCQGIISTIMRAAADWPCQPPPDPIRQLFHAAAATIGGRGISPFESHVRFQASQGIQISQPSFQVAQHRSHLQRHMVKLLHRKTEVNLPPSSRLRATRRVCAPP